MSGVCLISGGSSGIGLATARALQKAGYAVYELSRRAEGPEGFFHISADVRDEAAVQAAVQAVLARAGRIDLLINNAGFGISGAIEFTEEADAEAQLDVNFFGMTRLTRAVLPAMRAQGGGRVVNISSVAAPAAIPFQAYYSASKAAINAYTLALANEVRPFGITVCAVQPGDIRTGFTAARRKQPAGDDVYSGRISRSVGKMERDEQGGMDPAVAGRRIARIAMKRGHKPLYTIGFGYQCLCLLLKLLPARLANWAIGLLYAR